MKERLSTLNNYKIFSTHKQYLMGVATLLISLFHISLFRPELLHRTPYLYDTFATMNVGVEIFLYLSGIGLYFSFEKKPKFKDYYAKRVINVYVIFLIIALFYAIYHNFIIGEKSVLSFILEWTGVAYWDKEKVKYRYGWYVVYIMVLYLLYPLIYKILKALEKKKLDLVFTAVMCGVFVAVCILLNKYANGFYSFIEIGLTRMPIFLIGCYCGKLVFNNNKIGPLFYVLMVAGIIIRGIYINYETKPLIFNRLSQCLFSLAVMFIAIFLAEFLNISIIYKAFQLLGSMSLEFYLIHNYLREVLKDFGLTRIRHYFIMLAVTFVLSFILSRFRSFIVTKYTEKKKQKL